jgi:dihydropteroate synthase
VTSRSLPFVENPALPRGFLSGDETVERRVYLNPLTAEGERCEVLIRQPDRIDVVETTAAEVRAWARGEGEDVATHVLCRIENWAVPHASYAGLSLGRPLVMGIVNVTPDSFSDGGETFAAEDAIARGLALRDEGADIIDVGGESTRPGAAPITPEEEQRRVLPVIRGLAREGVTVSIDTRHAKTMAAALKEGARILNDVAALTDTGALSLAAATRAPVVLMHMQGEPATMQDKPSYESALLDVYDYLRERVAACIAAGIEPAAIAIDPGIGFGKTAAHNMEILARLGLFRGLGCPILIGVSRKLGRLLPGQTTQDRIGGSLAAGLAAMTQGAAILRVHDVAETRQALEVWQAVQRRR